MFKVNPNPTFTHDVKVWVPADGGFAEETLKTTFIAIPMQEHDRLAAAAVDDAGLTTFFDAIVKEFHDLADERGKPVAATPALRAQLLAMPYVATALREHYRKAMLGERAKN